jgi:HemK-like putative methylase
MKILGLDLAGSEKRKTGVALLNENLIAQCLSVFEDKEILDLVEKEKPCLICIDAPLSLPKGRKEINKKSKVHFRACDLELRKRKIKFFPITLGPMRKLTERGLKLKKILEKKYEVIEVYPGASQDILNIKRKGEGENKLKKGLENFGIKIIGKKIDDHQLDAITAAFTGFLYKKKKAIALGEKSEGQIIIPKPPSLIFENCLIDLSKGVFLPRAETMFWIKKALKKCKLKIEIFGSKDSKFLDIFSGSGIIGIYILKNIKKSFVDFVDIDKKAIDQIEINLKLNEISPKRYKVIKSNLFEKIKDKYDFIFANPPYVAKERLKEVQESVKKFEPKISWYGGKEGLFYIKKFLNRAKEFLKDNGLIFLEIDPLQKEKVKELLEKRRYKNYKFYKDQFGKIRWIEIEK